jgi:hypothetical protein
MERGTRKIRIRKVAGREAKARANLEAVQRVQLMRIPIRTLTSELYTLKIYHAT